MTVLLQQQQQQIIDIKKVKEFVYYESGYCITCDIHEKIDKGIRVKDKYNKTLRYCKDVKGRCYIRSGSRSKSKKKRLAENKEPLKGAYALSPTFRQCGFSEREWDNFGKHHIYLFLQYPQLNFKIPPVPDFDCLGKFNFNTVDQHLLHEAWKNDRLKDLKWCDHHINMNKADDRMINHGLTLSTEHGVIHGFYKKGKFNEAKKLMRSIAHRNLQLIGVTAMPLHFENFEDSVNAKINF